MSLDFLADATTSLVITIGMLSILGFMALAAWTSPKSQRHPEGRVGRFRDDLVCSAPFGPFLIAALTGALSTAKDEPWGIWLVSGLALFAVVGSFLPPVRRARKRVMSLQRFPSQ